MEAKNIYQALLEAQKEIEAIKKDATANAGSFKYNYATLGLVIETIKKPLNDRGIFISQPIMGDRVITSLIFTDGSKIEDSGTQIICAKANDPQAQGSAISYARRYGLMSLLCLSAEDDDGAKAMPHASPQPVKQTITPQTNEFSNSKCKDCGGGIKISASGKPYCSNKCWLPEGAHFRQEFNKVEDIIIPDDGEPLPF